MLHQTDPIQLIQIQSSLPVEVLNGCQIDRAENQGTSKDEERVQKWKRLNHFLTKHPSY